MKKIIAYILSMVMILPVMIFPEAVSAENEDFQKSDVVVGLGFMELYPTGKLENSNLISRAEFAEIMCKVANVPLEVGDASFDDVNSETIKKDYIYTAVKAGLLNGGDNNLFAPDEFVTFNQVVKTLVTILGYDKLAMNDGGYPIGYSKYAVQAGILNGLKNGGENEITRVQLASIIYNTIHAATWEMDNLSSTGNFGYREGKNMLEAYHAISSSEGIIEANDCTYINRALPADENCVVIESKPYTVEKTNAEELIGQNVEFYYRKNESGKNNLVFVVPRDNSIEYIEAEDLIRNKSTFSKFYWYDEDSEEQEAKLSGKLKVIYNGVYYFEALLSDLLPNVGDVTLIDNNQDDIYDIIVVNDYQLVYVSHTNTNSAAILEKNGSTIELKKFENIIYKKGNFESKDYNEIIAETAQDDILLVAEAKQAYYYIRILASNEKISEKFVKTNADGEYFTKKYVYKLNPYASALASSIDIGEEYILSLDAKGYIAEIGVADGSRYAYLIDARNPKKGLTESLAIKLYTTNQLIQSYFFAPNFELVKDGVSKRYKNEELSVAHSKFLDGSGKVVNQIVRYELNDMEQIIKLELPKTALGQKDDDGLALNVQGSYIKNAQGVLFDAVTKFGGGSDGKYSVRNAVMFVVPNSTDSSILNNDGFYSYKTNAEGMEQSKTYEIMAYDADENYNCGVLVYKANVGGSGGGAVSFEPKETVMFIIESVYEKLNADGEIITVASGYYNNAYVSDNLYNAEPVEYKVQDSQIAEISTLKRGDALLIVPRMDGYIDKYRIAVLDGKAQDAYSLDAPTNGMYYYSSTSNSAIAGSSASSIIWDAQMYLFSGVANKVAKNGNTLYNLFIDFENIDKYYSAEKTPDDIVNSGAAGVLSQTTNFMVTSNKRAVVYYDKKNDKMWLGDYDEIEPGDKVCISGFRIDYMSCLVIKN